VYFGVVQKFPFVILFTSLSELIKTSLLLVSKTNCHKLHSLNLSEILSQLSAVILANLIYCFKKLALFLSKKKSD
jgi:hypothetical protein